MRTDKITVDGIEFKIPQFGDYIIELITEVIPGKDRLLTEIKTVSPLLDAVVQICPQFMDEHLIHFLKSSDQYVWNSSNEALAELCGELMILKAQRERDKPDLPENIVKKLDDRIEELKLGVASVRPELLTPEIKAKIEEFEKRYESEEEKESIDRASIEAKIEALKAQLT